jgi:hypothetical protein
VLEIIPALVRAVEAADGANGFPEFLDGSCSDPPEMSLEFGKGHFDRIEVGAVGWQEEKPGAPLLEDGFRLFALMAGQVVEDDDVARPQGWCELGFDIGLEEGSSLP